MKVIKDNMQAKKKLIEEAAVARKNDADQVEYNMKMALEKEQAREREVGARLKRI